MTRPRPLPDAPPTPLVYKGLTVPYVAAWDHEVTDERADADLTVRTDLGGGNPHLAYTDEQPADRDRYGVLWHRVAWAQGHGRALFAQIHTQRQRTTMARGLCQVCSRPAQAWMVSAHLWREHAEERGPSAPYTTNDPPVCRTCAIAATHQCPHLSGSGYVFLSPRTWANTAVRGQVFDLATGQFGQVRLVALPGAIPPPDRAVLALTLAKGLVSTLFDVQVHSDLRLVAGLGQRRDQPATRPARPAPRRRTSRR
jgi:hypothetical protein